MWHRLTWLILIRFWIHNFLFWLLAVPWLEDLDSQLYEPYGVGGCENFLIHSFPKDFVTMWNSKSLNLDLNSARRVNFFSTITVTLHTQLYIYIYIELLGLFYAMNIVNWVLCTFIITLFFVSLEFFLCILSN